MIGTLILLGFIRADLASGFLGFSGEFVLAGDNGETLLNNTGYRLGLAASSAVNQLTMPVYTEDADDLMVITGNIINWYTYGL